MKRPPHGFILVTTLWMLVLMTIAAGFFALWTQQAVELARTNQHQAQAAIDIHDTQATLLFLLATQRFTVAGVTTETPLSVLGTPIDEHYSIASTGDEIRLDDRVYHGIGAARFTLQDKAGLLNLTKVTQVSHPTINAPVAHLLGQFGVAAEQRSGFIAKLQDYTDRDDLHQLNGAEAAHYTERGQIPPTNRLLFHPLEAQKVLDWDTATVLWHNEAWLHHTSTVFSGSTTNLNTAPLAILKTIPYFNSAAAERIVAYRHSQPFLNAAQLEAAIEIKITSAEQSLFDLGLSLFPSRYLRLCLWHANTAQMQRIDLELTFAADKRQPWRIDAHITTPLFHAYKTATPTPIRATLF